MLAGAVFGIAGDLPVVADFDGNGSTDIAVYRKSDGTYWVMDAMRFGSTGWITSGQIPSAFRSGRDVFVAADFDGDHRIGIGIWNDTSGVWSVLQSSSKTWRRQQFGLQGDSSQILDRNSDGRTDFVVWRPSTGDWHSLDSATASYNVTQWGWAGDNAVTDPSFDARKRLWLW